MSGHVALLRTNAGNAVSIDKEGKEALSITAWLITAFVVGFLMGFITALGFIGP